MRYPVVINHDKDTAYGVTVPDIPGCFSAGDSFDQALDNTIEAITGHLEILAENGQRIPKASNIEVHKDNPDYKEGVWGFVDVDIIPFLGKTEKINVTLPTILVRKIDEKHKNRSKFLAEAVLKELS